RSLSALARPGDLRRQRPRRRPGRVRARAASDPRLDARALLLRRVRDRLRSRGPRRPRGAAARARLRRRRAGLPRHRGRLRRRRAPTAAGDGGLPGGEAASAGAAMVVVAGPRIDPRTLPQHEGLEVRAYVHELYRHHAACDLAVVQGGLTTCMELTANRRPFLYFPLAHHFEQNFHVRHRLERYGAGRHMDYAQSPPEVIAAAIASEIGRQVTHTPVGTG